MTSQNVLEQPVIGEAATAVASPVVSPPVVISQSLSSDRKPLVVRLVARLNVGGITRHVTWLTAGFGRWGYRTLLVTGTVPSGEDDMGYFAEKHGIAPLFIPEMSREISLKDALVVWKLYRLFVRLRPDMVHTHSAKAGTAGRLAGFLYRWLTLGTLIGRPRRCRFVHTFHGHIFHSYYGPLKTRLFLAIERLLARLITDRIVVISPQQYREIHEDFGVGRAEQFAVIRLGLNLDAFADWSQRRQSLRKELGVRPTDRLVGIVGRLTEIKNHALFLQSVALYMKEHPSTEERRIQFLIIGDGHLRQSLEEQAQILGLEESVLFLGTRNDPEFFYPALDLVALTSLNEGTPLTLIEAMANARPVIATEVGGVVDLLGETAIEAKDGPDSGFTVRERGVLVRSRDVAAFARGLAWLLAEEGVQRAMGESGRAFVENYYSKERLLTYIRNLYEELLPPSRGPSVPETNEVC